MSRPKDDAEKLKAKLRSAQTMLTQERAVRREMEVIADSAVKALEDSNNGEIKEAVRALGAAREGYVRAAGALDAARAGLPATVWTAAGSAGAGS